MTPSKKKPAKSAGKKPGKKKKKVIEYLDPTLPKPVWDGHKLVLGNRVLVRLSQRAEELIKILDTFQAAGWAEWIPDPLDPTETYDRKARLRNQVAKLNAAIGRTGIVFKTNGGVEWRHAA